MSKEEDLRKLENKWTDLAKWKRELARELDKLAMQPGALEVFRHAIRTVACDRGEPLQSAYKALGNQMKAVPSDKAKFKARVRAWGDKLDVSIRSITIRSMSTKWASCSSSGRLTFDQDCLGLSKSLQDYVIVHELMHFSIPNHGRLWKSLMRAHLGDYEKADKRLARCVG